MTLNIIEDHNGTPTQTLLIDLRGISKLMGVSLSTLRRMIQAGKFLPALQFTEVKQFWRRSDVEEFIRNLPSA